MTSFDEHANDPPAVAEDETDPFGVCYAKHAQRLLVWLLRRTRDREIALDLWAETWAVVYFKRARIADCDDERAAAFAYGIAKRLMADWYRKGQIEQRALNRLGMQPPAIPADELDEVEREAGLEQLRNELAGALARLPSDQRRAVRLRVVDELPYGEVARRIGCREQTARARVSRGLRTLAKHLETNHVTREATNNA